MSVRRCTNESTAAGREFSGWTRRSQQLGAVGEELGRAALIGFDVGRLMADHTVIALAQARQRQAVSGGAGEYEVDITISLKCFADQFCRVLGPTIIPGSSHNPHQH